MVLLVDEEEVGDLQALWSSAFTWMDGLAAHEV